MKRKLPLATLVLLLLAGMLSAQTRALSETTENRKIDFGMNTPGPEKAILNEMITTVAAGNNQSPNQVNFIFRYKETVRIQEGQPGNFEVVVLLEDLKVEGELSYRKFSVREQMAPLAMNFDFVIKNKTDGPVDANAASLFQQQMRNQSLSGSSVKIASTSLPKGNLDPKNLLVTLENTEFLFDQAKSKLDARIRMIEDYHAEHARLKVLGKELEEIDPFDPDNVEVNLIKLERVEDRLIPFNLTSFHPLIQEKTGTDFLKIEEQILALEGKLKDLEKALEETRSRQAELIYQRGLGHMEAGNLLAASADFVEALKADPRYAPAHFQLAVIDFGADREEDAMSRVRNILLNLSPDAGTRRDTEQLAREILLKKIRKAEVEVQAGHPYTGLSQLYQAEEFCVSLQSLNCPPELSASILNTEREVYATYIENGERSLINGNLAAAEESVNEALEFQAKHPSAINSNADAKALRKRIRAAQYKAKIKEGKMLLEKSIFRTALKLFEEAKLLEEINSLVPDPELSELMAKAARPALADLSTQAKAKARANELQEAAELLEEFGKKQEEYGLAADAEMNATKEEIRKILFERQCDNSATEYKIALRKGREAIASSDFLAAENHLNDAIRAANVANFCNIDDTEALAEKKKILDALIYLKKMDKIRELVRSNKRREAIAWFVDTGKFLQDKELNTKFRMRHPSLENFAMEMRRGSFYIEVGEYLLDKKRFEGALDMVRELVKSRYPRYTYKPLMIDLAQKMAERDFQKAPAMDFKYQVKSYVNGRKGMGKFKRNYKKTFKRLKKGR